MSQEESASPGEPVDEEAVYTAKLDQCVEMLKQKDIRVVAFDMDLTAVAQHSRGRMRRGPELETFIRQATPDFRRLVPHLYKNGFQLAIATHSDQAEYQKKKNLGIIMPETHILGDELARAVLSHNFDKEIYDAFYVVSHNPKVRPAPVDETTGETIDHTNKRYHMWKLQRHFQVEPSQILMLDDLRHLVLDCQEVSGVNAIQVDETKGFCLEDLLDHPNLNYVLEK